MNYIITLCACWCGWAHSLTFLCVFCFPGESTYLWWVWGYWQIKAACRYAFLRHFSAIIACIVYRASLCYHIATSLTSTFISVGETQKQFTKKGIYNIYDVNLRFFSVFLSPDKIVWEKIYELNNLKKIVNAPPDFIFCEIGTRAGRVFARVLLMIEKENITLMNMR